MADYKDVIAEIKQSYDLADYIRSTGVELKPGGVGKWKARCPFHNEKTPSFVINDSFQNYHCFGCSASGDILSYVMGTENYTFFEAMKKLAEDKGITIEIEPDKVGIDYDSLYKILSLSAAFYCHNFDNLLDNHVAKKEITERNLTFNNQDKTHIKYGYAPNGNQLYKLLSKRGFSDELIVQSGMCRKNDNTGKVYDFFRSRLMFIFTDRAGKPIGFSSRRIFEDDTRGKYVNSSDSPLFHKNRVLYNHVIARLAAGKEKNMYICEGQFDVAAFVEASMPNAVASSGTAFSREHIAECNKLVGTNGKLTFCFDGDEAGLQAAMKIFVNHPNVHENSNVVMFPKGQDPCDYRLTNGDEQFREFVQNTMSMVEFVIERTQEQFDMDSVLDRSKYVQECARVAKTITNSLLRDNAIKTIALESFTSIDIVREAVDNAEPYTEDETLLNYDGADAEEEQQRTTLLPETDEQRFNKLVEYIEKDRFYDLCSRFISLGMTNKSWRSDVLHSVSLMPKPLQEFVQEFSTMEDKDIIFPELFEQQKLAQYLMERDYSPFYKFMTADELNNHFMYLHDEILREKERREMERLSNHIIQVISSGQGDSIAMLKKAMQREEALRQKHAKARQEILP